MQGQKYIQEREQCLQICVVWHQHQAEVIPEVSGTYNIIWIRVLEDGAGLSRSKQAPLFSHC